MKNRVVPLAIVAMALVVGGVLAAGQTSSAITDAPIVLQGGDARLQQAHDCLHVNGDEKIEQLLRVLEATGFALDQVTLRETRSDPERIRFGYEFSSKFLVKTIYWEADCPRKDDPSEVVSR